MANRQLGIEFEHVNMLKIQNVWKVSDAFAVILAQQRPVLVSAHAQNFFSWNSLKKKLKKRCREMLIAQPPRQVSGWLRLQMKDFYHIYNFVKKLFLWILCIEGLKVAQS